MRYPAIVRTLIGATGFGLSISGRRQQLVLSTCDRLFSDARESRVASIQIDSRTIRLDLANPGERLLYYAPHNLLRGYRNSDLFSIISRVASPFALFVDIGANLGLYSLLAREVGLETLMFEPEPVHYSFLSRNASVFGRAVDCALSNSSGTANFYVSGEANPGSSSLVMPEGGWNESEYERVVPVRLATFDAMIAELNVDAASIRLIKIDVEGNEEQTVRGMENYVRGRDAAPIWCEVRGPSSGRGRNSAVSVSAFLGGFGYVPFQIRKGDVIPLNIRQDKMPQVFDVLFTVPARHSKALRL